MRIDDLTAKSPVRVTAAGDHGYQFIKKSGR
jgi:hypothetical protein